MYSLLLMSAMTGAPEATEFNGFFRDLFTMRGGCSGSCSGSRAASQSPSGCCGGTRRALTSSCCGSGSAQYRAPAASCSGGSYYASCQGSSYAPSYAVMMQPMDYVPPSFGGCTGSMPMGYSDPPILGPSVPSGGSAPFAQPQPAMPPPPASLNENASLRRASYASITPESRATVIVRLPADASLSAEGRRLSLTGERREFVTPPLPPGDYRYGFRCDYDRGGESISRSKAVVVRAGEAFVVDFSEPDSRVGAPGVQVPAPTAPPAPAPAPARTTGANPPALLTPIPATAPPSTPTVPAPTGFGAALASSAGGAGAKARMLITLPAGAVLFIDGRNLDRPERTRQLETPAIPAGQSVTYLVRVERQGANGPESQQERVTIRGGEALPLDFTKWPGR